MKKALVASLGFVVLYNILFFKTGFGIGTSLVFLFLHVFFFVTKNPRAFHIRLAYTSSFLSILFSFFISLRSNTELQILSFLVGAFFAAVAFYFYRIEEKHTHLLISFLLIPVHIVVSGCKRFFLVTNDAAFDTPIKKPLFSAIIRGGIIAIPILGVLYLLLGSADPIFAKLTHISLEEMGERIIVSIVLFFFLVLIATVKVGAIVHAKKVMVDQSKLYELLIIGGSVAALLGIFLFIQLEYLFTNLGERDLHLLGIQSLTYSEYVRKGFFELILASSVVLTVLLYSIQYLPEFIGRRKTTLQATLLFLAGEVGLLIASAAKRLDLYQQAHGLTLARIYGALFLLWLAVLLVIFVIKVVKDLQSKTVLLLTLTVSLILLIIPIVINFDRLVATEYTPTVNSEIDYTYIASLSPDAYRSWQDVVAAVSVFTQEYEKKSSFSDFERSLIWENTHTLSEIQGHIAHLFLKYAPRTTAEAIRNSPEVSKLYGRVPSKDKFESMRKWQSYNFAEYEAYQYVVTQTDLVQNIKQLMSVLQKFQQKTEMQSTPPVIRSETSTTTQVKP